MSSVCLKVNRLHDLLPYFALLICWLFLMAEDCSKLDEAGFPYSDLSAAAKAINHKAI
tara:strand:+ start:4339 stop:4512 length:174 start_codon:yes stop_codon:yes gene_type:complete